jgi:hypothetical protein
MGPEPNFEMGSKEEAARRERDLRIPENFSRRLLVCADLTQSQKEVRGVLVENDTVSVITDLKNCVFDRLEAIARSCEPISELGLWREGYQKRLRSSKSKHSRLQR